MNEDAVLIAEAIAGLRNDASLFRDYLFPIVSGFFSAVLGAWVAYFALKFQERNQLEREKLITCNEWTITMEGVFQSLIAFKENYCTEVGTHPFQRALSVRSILGQSKPLEKNVADLSFIVPTKSDPDSLEVKWRSISRIGGLVSNYNSLLIIWEKRNAFERPLREKLINSCGDSAFAEISHADALKILGPKDLLSLIDLTERAIVLTDDLVIETNNFLEEFPEVAKSVIDTKRTKGFGTLIKFSNRENPHLQKLLTRCVEMDCRPLVDLYGIPEERLRELYGSVYQHEPTTL